MFRKSFLYALFFLSFMPLTASALSEPNIVILEDANSVDDAVVAITSTLESQGFEIVLTLDHSANAAGVMLTLAPTTVIFARLPKKAERAILRKGETVAIDLPVKFLVFEQDDEIRLATNAVGYLIDRHTLTTKDKLLDVIDKFQDQFGKPDDGLITVESTRSVEDTALSLQDAIGNAGPFGIPLVLDYGERQNSAGSNSQKKDDPILIVFGNPLVGTPLMQEQQSIGIDLPQKFLVWEDDSGTVNITYNDPSVLADRHSIENQGERLAAVSTALGNFANAGAGR